jgi:ssDNA thymidine ADP-ribosyltransferase, DarT
MPPLSETLTPEKALIFRITHRDNVPWILQNGLHCQSSGTTDPDFVVIGNPELISLRPRREVDIPPGGTLADYIPFYFTPCSPMLLNITTGYAGIRQRTKAEIVVLVSSLDTLRSNGVRYVYSDRHAYLETATFFDDPARLGTVVDFGLLRRRDFKRDPEQPDKVERYQAEALAYRHVPAGALLGIGCYTPAIRNDLKTTCSDLGVKVKIVHRPEWYP